jgi:hypothetical protein
MSKLYNNNNTSKISSKLSSKIYPQTSLTTVLKQQFLKPVLELVNENLLKNPIAHEQETCVLLNNNKKYYLYVNFRKNLEHYNGNDNLLYFFPDKSTVSSYLQIKNTLSEFYLEIDNYFKDSYLFEGYFYNNTDYLITDVLVKNNKIISMDYPLRQSLVIDLLSNYTSSSIINIGVHPVFNIDNDQILKIFLDNFKYSSELIAKELVFDFNKINTINNIPLRQSKKLLKKSKYYDVYYVYNIDTGNSEGILYIKGISESKYIKQLFEHNSERTRECIYNKVFFKWEMLDKL